MFTVLVVDDDREISETLNHLLTAEGYRVTCVSDGEAALASIATQPVHVILSDVLMPVMDGVTMLRRLRTAGDTTPVVLMSATGVPPSPESEALFISKPFDFVELLTLLEQALQGR